MNEDQVEELRLELQALTDKYGIKSASFCGTASSNYVAFCDLGEDRTIDSTFQAILSVGRLWQFAREQSRSILNSFERK